MKTGFSDILYRSRRPSKLLETATEHSLAPSIARIHGLSSPFTALPRACTTVLYAVTRYADLCLFSITQAVLADATDDIFINVRNRTDKASIIRYFLRVMPLSDKDRRYILINTMIEHERMFTVLGHLCANDPDKTQFLAEIEERLKDCLRKLEEIEPGESPEKI